MLYIYFQFDSNNFNNFKKLLNLCIVWSNTGGSMNVNMLQNARTCGLDLRTYIIKIWTCMLKFALVKMFWMCRLIFTCLTWQLQTCKSTFIRIYFSSLAQIVFYPTTTRWLQLQPCDYNLSNWPLQLTNLLSRIIKWRICTHLLLQHFLQYICCKTICTCSWDVRWKSEGGREGGFFAITWLFWCEIQTDWGRAKAVSSIASNISNIMTAWSIL